MKQISSRDNPLFKQLKQLATSAAQRRKAARTLLDGVHLCEVYLERVGVPSLCIVSDTALHNPEVATIVARCEAGGGACIHLPDPLYDNLSQVEQGVGVLFAIDTPSVSPPSELTCDAVLLDNLQDPGNLGSILRSAAAAGVQQVLCGSTTAHCWSPKVLRAGMGAHFCLAIHENVDLAAWITACRTPVLATSSHVVQQIFDLDLTQPVAWLFGNEGQGVAPHLLALATSQVAIPHRGPIESLNVAASAAICLFEQLRQRR